MNHRDFALKFAKIAGDIIWKNFRFGMKKEWKKDMTPVTESDIAINKLLIKQTREYFPDMGVLAEEKSYESRRNDLWVCDPLDGTIPFSHALPYCAFSLARVKDGEVILGVIYDPFWKRFLYAEKGKGAFLNKKRIFVSKAKSLKNQLVDLEIWSRADYYNDIPIDLAHRLNKDDALIIRLCSIVYGAILVATGEAVGAYFAGNTAHDIAAAKIIIEEAGGRVSNLFGEEQKYNQPIKGAILSNGKVHSFLINSLKGVNFKTF